MTEVFWAEIVFPIITCASWLDQLLTNLRYSRGPRISDHSRDSMEMCQAEAFVRNVPTDASSSSTPTTLLFLHYYYYLLLSPAYDTASA